MTSGNEWPAGRVSEAAKPVLREVADATVSFPYLDAALLVMGITPDDVQTTRATA
jgi:phosphoserine phosphatase